MDTHFLSQRDIYKAVESRYIHVAGNLSTFMLAFYVKVFLTKWIKTPIFDFLG